MMHFNIVCVGKIKETYLQTAIADYAVRLSKYVKFDIIEVPEDNSAQIDKRIEKLKNEKFSGDFAWAFFCGYIIL